MKNQKEAVVVIVMIDTIGKLVMKHAGMFNKTIILIIILEKTLPNSKFNYCQHTY